MKDYHKILTEDYKFSTWVSYAFFTAATILVGGLLGLVSNMFISLPLLQTSEFTFRLPSRSLIFRTAMQAGFISSQICSFKHPSRWPAWPGLVSNIIILLQISAFTFRVPNRNLIFRTALPAGFISSRTNTENVFRLALFRISEDFQGPSWWPSWPCKQSDYFTTKKCLLLEFHVEI